MSQFYGLVGVFSASGTIWQQLTVHHISLLQLNSTLNDVSGNMFGKKSTFIVYQLCLVQSLVRRSLSLCCSTLRMLNPQTQSIVHTTALESAR